MSRVTLKRLSKTYPGGMTAVDGLDLEVRQGEFFTLLGPSGCGKTTTLRMIAGLETPTSGEVWIGDRNCTVVHPRDRGIGLVFQSYALYPHMSVRQNIALNLIVGGMARAEADRRVEIIAAGLRLAHLLDRRPRHLSGGERQRVALGRALVRNPEVLLMDEPLSNLDLKLREHMRIELRRLHAELKHTVICVTHDQAEALSMSDRIAVMQSGRVEQVGTPDEVYDSPTNLFVASFLGSPSINQFVGTLVESNTGCLVSVDGHEKLAQRLSPSLKDVIHDRQVIVGVRPEDILVGEVGEGSAVAARVSLVEPLGSSRLVCLDLDGGGDDKPVMATVPAHRLVTLHQTVTIAFRPGSMLIFDPKSQNCLGRSVPAPGLHSL